MGDIVTCDFCNRSLDDDYFSSDICDYCASKSLSRIDNYVDLLEKYSKENEILKQINESLCGTLESHVKEKHKCL